MGRVKEFYFDLINNRDPFIDDDEYFYNLHLEDLKYEELYKQETKDQKIKNLNKWKKKI